MPQITNITRQKKAKRFNIFIDDVYSFSVDEFNLLKYQLKVGQKVTDTLIDQIITKEKFSYFLDLTLGFLGVRPRSKKEIADYLLKKISLKESVNFSDAKNSPIIVKIIQRLSKYDYVDDNAFAMWYLQSKSKKAKSLRLVKNELKAKGVSADILENIRRSSSEEVKTAIASVEKKLQSWKKLNASEYKKKFFRHLSFRGYDYETIKEAFAFFKEKR